MDIFRVARGFKWFRAANVWFKKKDIYHFLEQEVLLHATIVSGSNKDLIKYLWCETNPRHDFHILSIVVF